MTSALVVAGCAVVIGLLGYLIWRGDQQINDATRRAFGEQRTAPTGTSHVRILDDYREHARREADKRRGGDVA